MQVWILLTLSSAVINSFVNIVIKDLGVKIDEYAAGFIRNLLTLPLFWGMLFISGVPVVKIQFWWFILILLPFEVLLTILYQKAFKFSPVSLVVPIISLSPIFIAVVSFFIFGERLTLNHLVAVVCFVGGVYFLNLNSKNKNILAPIISLYNQKGVFFMLLVALILGVTVSVGKQAIVSSSPQFFSAIYYSLLTMLLFPIYKSKSKLKLWQFTKHKKQLIFLATLNPLSSLLVFSAFKLGPTALVQSLNSTSTLFSVILAGAFLKETGIKKRVIASGLIILGSVLIVMK